MTKQKIDFDKKPKKIKDKYRQVEPLIISANEDDATGEVDIMAQTLRRVANGRPPMEIINPDLEAALNDIATLAGVA